MRCGSVGSAKDPPAQVRVMSCWGFASRPVGQNKRATPYGIALFYDWSGREDLNLRPLLLPNFPPEKSLLNDVIKG